MDRFEVLDNYYMVKEAWTGVAALGGGAYAGHSGRERGMKDIEGKYKNLTREDLRGIKEDSKEGAGRGAIRGWGYGLGGGLLGGYAGSALGKSRKGALIGALAGTATGAGQSYLKSRQDINRRAERLSRRLDENRTSADNSNRGSNNE
jgi:hypothetical protein